MEDHFEAACWQRVTVPRYPAKHKGNVPPRAEHIGHGRRFTGTTRQQFQERAGDEAEGDAVGDRPRERDAHHHEERCGHGGTGGIFLTSGHFPLVS